MERRWTERSLARLDVELHSSDEDIAMCMTRDISFGGAFVEMKAERPELDSKLDLVFKLRENEQNTKYRVHAKVVRMTDDGFGVMFNNFDASAFRSLREVLRHKDDQSAH